jgi:hypothetical protein
LSSRSGRHRPPLDSAAELIELALARLKAGELDYANDVEDVLRKVPERADRSPR